jgi:hypothetical protein
MKLTIILETADNDFQGVISHPSFTILAVEDSMDKLIDTFKEQIQGFLDNECKGLPEWEGIKIEDIEFDYAATVEGLFDTFDFLKISVIARETGINASQLRQYASGIKYPSIATAKKIEQALHRLAQSMLKMQVAQLPPSRVAA